MKALLKSRRKPAPPPEEAKPAPAANTPSPVAQEPPVDSKEAARNSRFSYVPKGAAMSTSGRIELEAPPDAAAAPAADAKPATATPSRGSRFSYAPKGAAASSGDLLKEKPEEPERSTTNSRGSRFSYQPKGAAMSSGNLLGEKADKSEEKPAEEPEEPEPQPFKPRMTAMDSSMIDAMYGRASQHMRGWGSADDDDDDDDDVYPPEKKKGTADDDDDDDDGDKKGTADGDDDNDEDDRTSAVFASSRTYKLEDDDAGTSPKSMSEELTSLRKEVLELKSRQARMEREMNDLRAHVHGGANKRAPLKSTPAERAARAARGVSFGAEPETNDDRESNLIEQLSSRISHIFTNQEKPDAKSRQSTRW